MIAKTATLHRAQHRMNPPTTADAVALIVPVQPP